MKTQQTESQIPPIFTATIEVNSFDAKQFIATLESDLRIWEGMTSDTAKARAQITRQHLDAAKELLGVNRNIAQKMADAFHGSNT